MILCMSVTALILQSYVECLSTYEIMSNFLDALQIIKNKINENKHDSMKLNELILQGNSMIKINDIDNETSLLKNVKKKIF